MGDKQAAYELLSSGGSDIEALRALAGAGEKMSPISSEPLILFVFYRGDIDISSDLLGTAKLIGT